MTRYLGKCEIVGLFFIDSVEVKEQHKHPQRKCQGIGNTENLSHRRKTDLIAVSVIKAVLVMFEVRDYFCDVA